MQKPNQPPKPFAADPQTVHQHGRGFWAIVFLVLVVTSIGLYYFRPAAPKAAGAGRMGGQVVPVVPGKVQQKDVPIYLDGLGTAQAYNTVTVHSRVDGQLVKVAFTEGQEVHTGDLLAQIDPAPFQAQLAQNQAKKQQDEAQLANARLDLQRNTELVAQKIASQQVLDTQQALVNQLIATVKADQASIESAQVQLNYTTISSPIDGRVGIRQMDQGNIVHANDTNGLVVITQLKPISVLFTLPEQMLGQINQQKGSADFSVLAVDRDNSTILGEGKLSVIDNQIDTTTGTIRLKATFPNEDLRLWPGQFVNARLLLTTRKNGVVIPAAAVQRGPEGSYAFVIKEGQPPAKEDHAGKDGQASKDGVAAKEGQPAGEKSDQKPHGKRAGGKPGEGGAPTQVSTTAEPAAKPAHQAPPRDGQASPAGPDGKEGKAMKEFYVEVRTIKVAQIEKGQALIDDGLSAGELVVVEGQYRLQANSPVKLRRSGKPADGDTEP